MYDDLVEALRLCVKYGKTQDALENAEQAAIAIEELSLTAESYKRSMEAWADEAANVQPRWISVTERLPEEHIRVLVVNDDAKFMVAERAEGDWWYQYFAYDVDRWDALEQGVITHWMPLPEPPKEVDT